MGNVYNSISIIFFVLLCILSARRQEISIRPALVLPVLLFVLMALSLLWSLDVKSSLRALGKEASLLFIPLAFFLIRRLNRKCTDDVLKNYSLVICLFALYCLTRAIVRYTTTGSPEVFFYHELSGPGLNAIYLSILVSLALFEFLSKKNKTFWGYGAMLMLLFVVFLLSSKNIIIVDIALIITYYLFFSGLPKKTALITTALFCILAAGMGYYGKIHERIAHEIEPAQVTVTSTGVHNVTISEAWLNTNFSNNDYFNGTAFRTYQLRIFIEMLQEEPILFTGYGLNASIKKIEQKGIEHNIYRSGTNGHVGYNKFNFHNQYIEAFADMGVFGFLLVVAMVLINLKNGIRSKYFVHIAFAILMISLFLTESFLWRQRGVVFFTLFYCLFNDVRSVKHINMPQESEAL
jgi:O-antigen ligase